MYDYLEQQPVWDAATLHASLGKARHEVLFFADQGAAGSFLAVPNVIREGSKCRTLFNIFLILLLSVCLYLNFKTCIEERGNAGV
jgi:hypothetical protein